MRLTDLESGVAYVVRESFRDDQGTLVLPGDVLTLDRIVPIPVTGAFEVHFREEVLVLQGDRQSDVVEHVERFLRDAAP